MDERETRKADRQRNRSLLCARPFDDSGAWQIASIKKAIASLDSGNRVSHEQVEKWITSWGSGSEHPIPRA
jgi:predicted transcriptional regulator